MSDEEEYIDDEDAQPRKVRRYLIWAAMAGVWLMIAAALVSYDPGDWPNRYVAPHNEHASNWVGRAGAWVAAELYDMIGPGVWIMMAGALAGLVTTARRKPITQPVLRSIGLILMSLAASALIGLTMSAGRSHILSAGGLLADYINRRTVFVFSGFGTLLILLTVFWVGAIVAMDQVVAGLGRIVLWGCHLLGNHVHLPRPVLAGRSLGWGALLGLSGTATSLKPNIPLRRNGRSLRSPVDDDDQIDPDAGGLGATEAFGKGGAKNTAPISQPDEDEDKNDPVDSLDDQPQASFNPPLTTEQLRAKIRKLPINLAGPNAAPKTPPPREVDLSGYRFPEIAMLDEPEGDFTQDMERLVRDQAVQLEAALQQYRIDGQVVGIDSGPVITLFEVRLAPGTKVAQLSNLSSDIARVLKAHNVRIVPNMAGKDTVGIEVPNLKKQLVRLKELMTSQGDTAERMKLPMWLGKDASGNPLIADLAAMPHMLIAGTTGSGKSVCMNSIIMSFLFTKRPDEMKLVLVDPKMVEMALFREIPHLMCPVVTEMSKAAAILEWATTKMDERYELLAEVGVRDIVGYNDLTWEQIVERMEPANEAEEARIPRKLPYLVFVVDELADLMMTTKEVEGFIVRLAQKSRAVGLHLILATQRPQANVVTGLIKSNMPCRVSFKVASGMDSRIVLDQKGAELLLGQGDMLYLSPRTSKITRAQGTLVDDSEIRRTVRFLKQVAGPSFEPALVQIKSPGASGDPVERDPLFEDAVRIVLESNRGSVSLLQRRLTIGYSRASRLIEQMAGAGILGEYKGSQAREVQISIEEWDALRAQAQADAAADSETVQGDEQSEEVTEQDELVKDEEGVEYETVEEDQEAEDSQEEEEYEYEESDDSQDEDEDAEEDEEEESGR